MKIQLKAIFNASPAIYYCQFNSLMPFLSDDFCKADRLSRGQDKLLSRSMRQLFGLCRRDDSYSQGENREAKSVVLRAIQALSI